MITFVRMVFGLMGIILFSLPSSAYAEPPATFQKAKKIARIIFSAHPKTLYCGCHFDALMRVNLASCHMQSAASLARAHLVEWEHMMPAENFGRHFLCWREAVCHSHKKSYKGRKCCKKIDPLYRRAEAELYNLWPAVGLVNQARSNYRFAELQTDQTYYGCQFKVDNQVRKVEPSNHAKGIVARANLFMADKYHIRLSKAQRALFLKWSICYPPDSWEKKWAATVAKLEGYNNPYIG